MSEQSFPIVMLEKPWDEITGSIGFGHIMDAIDATGTTVHDLDLFSGFNAQPLLNGNQETQLRLWAVTAKWWLDNLISSGEQQGVPILSAIHSSLEPGSRPGIGIYNRSHFRRLNIADNQYGRYSLKRDREIGIEAALTALVLLPPTGASIAAREKLESPRPSR